MSDVRVLLTWDDELPCPTLPRRWGQGNTDVFTVPVVALYCTHCYFGNKISLFAPKKKKKIVIDFNAFFYVNWLWSDFEFNDILRILVKFYFFLSRYETKKDGYKMGTI